MNAKGSIGLIADDLTGACDTALQFFTKGSNTEIVLDVDSSLQNHLNVGTRAFSTETRNIDPKVAAQIVWENAQNLKNILSVENFYKKIDSTLRGNIAVETLSVLDSIEYDAAVIAPAFIQEGRITIGGYQLLKGIPIERTDAARDTYAPIYDSYIPDILKRQVNENLHDIITTIELKTVAKGAGPITSKINELVQKGKKLIVADAVCATDLEQIALAIQKSKYKILPVGSAGLAGAISSIWVMENTKDTVSKQIPKLPKLILSGSKTSITATQINKLKMDDDIENTYFIDLCLDDILKNKIDEMSEKIVNNLGKENVVILHASEIEDEIENGSGYEKLIDEGITREVLAGAITDFLSKVAFFVKKKANFILITIGGETSHKIMNAIESKYLQIIDAILPSIPLCIDSNAGFIITKSGNMGMSGALVDIIKYLKHHEKE